MNQFNESGLMDQAKKAAVTGGIGYALSRFVLFSGRRTEIWPLFGKDLNQHLFVGLAVAGASVAADWLHAYILPQISHDNKMVEQESAILTPALGALALLGAAYVGNSYVVSHAGAGKLLLAGAASEVGGSVAYGFLKTMIM